MELEHFNEQFEKQESSCREIFCSFFLLDTVKGNLCYKSIF